MKFIDTHSHIFLEEFDEDRSEVVKRALSEGVEKILLPNIDSSSFPQLIKMHREYPSVCLPMIGLHPTSVDENYRSELDFVREKLEAKQDSYVGIGEIGIDLYWDKTYQKEQTIAFIEQVEMAKEYNFPIIIHSRDSFGEIFAALNGRIDGGVKGVFHSFTGNYEQARQIIDMGFVLGINGIVTFKNSKLGEVVEKVDLSHLLIETDSPYLAPVPKRGKRNESVFVKHVAEKIAEIKGVSLDFVAKVTTDNAQRLFNLTE